MRIHTGILIFINLSTAFVDYSFKLIMKNEVCINSTLQCIILPLFSTTLCVSLVNCTYIQICCFPTRLLPLPS